MIDALMDFGDVGAAGVANVIDFGEIDSRVGLDRLHTGRAMDESWGIALTAKAAVTADSTVTVMGGDESGSLDATEATAVVPKGTPKGATVSMMVPAMHHRYLTVVGDAGLFTARLEQGC